MKIAILTAGILPVPAVQGGAVENLIDMALAYNDVHQNHQITVVGVYHPDAKHHKALLSKVNHYIFIDKKGFWHRLRARLYGIFHPNTYYHYQLEYFLEQEYKKIKGEHFDLIIIENRPGFAIKLKKRTHTPIVSHIHTDLVNPESNQAAAIIASTDAFLCVSEYIKRRVVSVSPSAKVSVVYNGLDTKQFSLQAGNQISRKTLGFAEDDFVVIYTGRIVPKKGVKELMQAIQLLDKTPDVKLLVVGGDNFADSVAHNPFLDELHEMGEKMNGRVCFTGYVPYNSLPSYLSLANLAVIPSRINEALGMTCIEATAMGLPVVATNDGGIPETLRNQKHILIDKNGHLPKQIASAIMHVKTHYSEFTGNHLCPTFTKDAYAASFFQAISQYKYREDGQVSPLPPY